MSTPQSNQTIGDNDQSIPRTDQPITRKPLRLWPGVVGAVLILLGWFIVPNLAPVSTVAVYAMLAGMVGVLFTVVWWLGLSRARWYERLGALAFIVAAIFVTYRLVHISIQNGAMGNLLYVLIVPVFCLALVAWAVAVKRLSVNRSLSPGVRGAALVLAILLVCGGFTLIRTGGITANFDNDIHWRWSKTPEEQLLAQTGDEPTTNTSTASATTATGVDWPGFRGPNRDSIVRGTKINMDWAAKPPVEVWRRPIGPGWSSFAVHGDLVYTQEQRGDQEVVACYDLKTGKLVWKHSDAARFWESNAGAGPRGTPTLSNGRVYALGATGIMNVLDATDGKVIWSRNAASDTKTKTPGWGFSSSPLVLEDKVVVATAGNLIAYDLANGEPKWSMMDGGGGYSSPQLMTIGGVEQVVLLGGAGATGIAPADGKKLWQFPMSTNTRIAQPAITSDGDVLVHDGEGNGLRRIAVTQGSGGWTVQERWLSEGLNVYFNDFVVHKGHAYGFEGSSIACIDLKDGNRKWKGGRYGHGQLVLLADQDLLLLVTEEGDLALVKASPDQFVELGRVSAIKGKTWNHPVLAGDVLLVRNGEEMAAFRLQS
ncbi:MAG TPA: PQQ-binding-like beta-propeller repeat protein [Pyrinomonadaceae bacterium]|nr:PQQ-binding-like beta-propeller repeat protein [Pyrinomonadaceae bacterium]